MKTCTKCGAELPATTEFFARHKPSKDGLKPRCKPCHNNNAKQHYARRPDKDTVKRNALLWAKKNPEKYRAIVSASRRRSLKKPARLMVVRFGNLISITLRERGYQAIGRQWVVPYTPDDLVCHLESKFQEGMSWENYGLGGWQIDHVVPRSKFAFRSPEDLEFAACWALNNIQPLWQKQNLQKGAREWVG